MSKPRFRWWGYMKSAIRAYPELCDKLQTMKNQSITLNYSFSAGGSGVSRTAEAAALRELTGIEAVEYDTVRRAIENTGKLKNGAERQALIDMVFFKQSHSLEGAAMALFVSYQTAKRWHNDFILEAGKCYGLLDGNFRRYAQ